MAECLYVDECGRKSYAKGMCLMHYKRVWRHGSVNRRRIPASAPGEEQLRHKGWTVTDSGCWEWNGGRRAFGHGTVGRSQAAHRLAYETWVGPIPEGLIVRHKCDNPPCVNPDHLEIGTHADNAWDMTVRNRFYSKLTEQDVRDIREEYAKGVLTQQMLADVYGVSNSNICRIITRKGWSHID